MFKTGDKVEKTVDNKTVTGIVMMHEEHDGPAQSVVVRWDNNTTVYETAENIRPYKESSVFNALNKHKFSVGDKVEKWVTTNQTDNYGRPGTDLAAGVVIAVEINLVFVKWDNLDGNFIEKWESPKDIQLRDWNTRNEEKAEATQRVYKYYDNLTCIITKAFWDRVVDTFTERRDVLTVTLVLSDGMTVNRPVEDILYMNKASEVNGTILALQSDIWESK